MRRLVDIGPLSLQCLCERCSAGLPHIDQRADDAPDHTLSLAERERIMSDLERRLSTATRAANETVAMILDSGSERNDARREHELEARMQRARQCLRS